MQERLQAVLDAAVVDRGGILFASAAGHARVDAGRPLTPDAVFEIASMTKPLVSLAAVRLVERGILNLDAPAADVLPVLADRQVLQADGTLRPAVGAITLRHLLTHTSGFGYAFTSPLLARYQAGPNGPSGIDLPLLADPGTAWHYGVGLDWVGRMIEAAAGEPLDTHLERQILTPLGMVDTSYRPTPAQLQRRVSLHLRRADGTLVEQPPEAWTPHVGGGAGLASTAPDYARFLRFCLGDGELDGVRLLRPETMDAFTAHQTGDIAAGDWVSGEAAASCDLALSDGGTARWSLGSLRSGRDRPGRRRAGSLSWAGLRNTWFWVDRSAGVGAVLLMQSLPFADPRCLAVVDAVEAEVYAALPA